MSALESPVLRIASDAAEHKRLEERIERHQRHIAESKVKIDEWCKSRNDDELARDILNVIVACLGAQGGAIWEGLVTPVQLNAAADRQGDHMKRLAESGLVELNLRHSHRMESLAAVASVASVVVPPESAGRNETRYLQLVVPIVDNGQTIGAIEIYQRNSEDEETRVGYLRYLEFVSDALARFVTRRQLSRLQHQTRHATGVLNSLRDAARSTDREAFAIRAVNEVRRESGCDRVTLISADQNSVLAISGATSWHKRSPHVRALIRMTRKCLRKGKLEQARERPSFVAVSKYLEQTGAHQIIIRRTSQRIKKCPILVFEYLSPPEQPPSIKMIDGLVLSWSPLVESQILLSKASLVRRGLLGFLRRVVSWSLFALILLILTYPLVAWQRELTLVCRGRIIPSMQERLYSPEAGVVAEVSVGHGETVTRDQIVARLDSTELQKQLVALEGERDRSAARHSTTHHQLLNSPRLSTDEQHRLAAEMEHFETSLRSIESRIHIIKRQLESLEVRSPIDGVVVTWDPRKKLLNRPVNIGEQLLIVADVEQPWQVEILVPESNIRKVIDAQQRENELRVSYTLLSQAGTYKGHVIEIDNVATDDPDLGRCVRVKVALQSRPTKLQTETTVHAHIHCGNTSLGYALFHEWIDGVQRLAFDWIETAQ